MVFKVLSWFSTGFMHKWPNISPKGTFLGKKCRRVVVSTQNVYPLELYPGPTIPSRPYAAKGSSMNDDDDEAALREVGGQEEGKLLLVPRFDYFSPCPCHCPALTNFFLGTVTLFLWYQFAAGWQPGIHTPA